MYIFSKLVVKQTEYKKHSKLEFEEYTTDEKKISINLILDIMFQCILTDKEYFFMSVTIMNYALKSPLNKSTMIAIKSCDIKL